MPAIASAVDWAVMPAQRNVGFLWEFIRRTLVSSLRRLRACDPGLDIMGAMDSRGLYQRAQ